MENLETITAKEAQDLVRIFNNDYNLKLHNICSLIKEAAYNGRSEISINDWYQFTDIENIVERKLIEFGFKVRILTCHISQNKEMIVSWEE